MKQRSFLFLLIITVLTVAVTAFAAQDGAVVASVDKDIHLRIKKSAVLPPVVSEKYEYYEIEGSSVKELRCQMSEKGCRWDDGKKYDSLTSWHVKWDYGYDRAPQACTPASFRATVEIIFRYPEWVRTDGAPQPLVAKWDSYMKNLINHENGHRDMAVQAAAELSRAVAELPPASNCAELDREVRELCRLRMKKLKENEYEYDAATNHGLTQGAIFP